MRRPLRVLFVEDRDDDAELLAAELRRSGFDVTWTRCDNDADLHRALTTPPDLVFCDFGLPGMDAVEVLSTLNGHLPDVPVLVVSAVVDADVAPILFQHGAADLLHKDRLARLGSAVTDALARKEAVIQARQAAQRERETAADLLSGLVNNAPAAICISRLDGTPLVANAQYEEVLRRVPARQRSRLTALGEAARTSATAAQREVRLGGATFLALGYPVVDAAGELVATGLILTDISVQKSTEVELRSVRAELRARARQLRRRNAELVELDRLKTNLVSTVSHELRTPLTSILGYSELLGDGEIGEGAGPTLRMIEMISRNGQRLLNLIDNLLVLAQVDSARPGAAADAPMWPVCLGDVIEAVQSVILPSALAAGLTLVAEVASDVPPVPGDRDQLERVLLNLTANAVKFSKAGGTVTLRLAPAPGRVVIEVSDEGIGMSEQDLALLGTKFFRSDSARIRQLPGTGLGVSVVYSIVTRHGGSVEYISRPGEGTTARIELPVAPQVVRGPAASPAGIPSPRRSEALPVPD
jgi:signal transduction histidine kinase